MTTHTPRSRSAATLIASNFDRIAQQYALRGTLPPLERQQLIEKYKNARTRLIEHLMA